MVKKVNNEDNIGNMYSEEELKELAQELGSEVVTQENSMGEQFQPPQQEFLSQHEQGRLSNSNTGQITPSSERYVPQTGQQYVPQEQQVNQPENNRQYQQSQQVQQHQSYQQETPKEEQQPKQSVNPPQQQVQQQQPVPIMENKPRIDIHKVPETLAEFEALEEYKKSPEYQQELNKEQELNNFLSNREAVREIVKSSSIDMNDLSSITIQDKDRTVTSKQNTSYLRSADPIYQVVLNQSAYTADMKSLKFQDIFALSNSVNNTYSGTLDKYQTYFRAIANNSLGINQFEKWIEVTSLYDVSTIEFGIFNQTFPGDTEFDIKCSHCTEQMKNVAISNDSLISTRNDGVYEQLDRVINNINNLDKAAEFSLINKINRFQLPDSNAVIDIHIPTIADYLKLLEQVPDGKLHQIENYIDVMLFIKDIFVVDVAETKKQGKPVFNPLETRNEILAFLQNMALDDVAKLNKEIGDRDSKYRIDYQIQSFDCLNCSNPTGNIDIDIESLLFEEAVAKVIIP